MVRLLTLSGLILLLAAPTASAGVREKILRECQEGRITGDYTPGQLRDARKNIPTDIDEYSDCRDVLARAALTGRSGGGDGGAVAAGPRRPAACCPAGAAATPRAHARHRRSRRRSTVARARDAPHHVDGERIVPARRASPPTRPATDCRRTLLTVLVLLGLCAIAAAGPGRAPTCPRSPAALARAAARRGRWRFRA